MGTTGHNHTVKGFIEYDRVPPTNGKHDPRLRRFVNGFRISEIAPLSGDRCTLGVGNPKE